MSDLFVRRAASTPTRSSAMSKLIEEGKALNTEMPVEAPRRKPRSRIWDMMHGVGIFACFIFIGVQLSSNFGAAAALSPTEIAAEERIRDSIERCMMVFWEISEVLKKGQVPGDSLRCTEPGFPNIIARVDDDIIVHHPQPQLLGYSDIFITKSNPVPVLVQ